MTEKTENDAETKADSEADAETDARAESASDAGTRRWSRPLAATNVVLAILLLGGLSVLPTRWLPVDVPAVAFALALAATGVGLWIGAPWAPRAARIVAAVTLVAGALLCTALAFTAAHISGLYGPVGSGGAILLGVVALLLLPYLVLIPAAQLWLLLGER